MSVFRIYVEKKPEFAVEAQSVLDDDSFEVTYDLREVHALGH